MRDWGWVLLVVLGFKQLYAMAGAGELQWLLWPLATLLNTVSPLSFAPTPAGEWVDAEHGLVIVKTCAGGNFLIASWLGYLWRRRVCRVGLAAALASLGAAWLTTLGANGLRILLIAYGQDAGVQTTGLAAADAHRLIGILVYFGVLWMQVSRCGSSAAALTAATTLYLGITLVLPALHGMAIGRGALDATHLLWTAGIPVGILVARWVLGRRWALCHRRA
jgi:exosortase K